MDTFFSQKNSTEKSLPPPRIWRGFGCRSCPPTSRGQPHETGSGLAGFKLLERFYFPDKPRAMVINPRGEVVGAVEFEFDRAASKFYADRHMDGLDSVYSLDEAALEDLLARATAPQP